MSDHSDLRGFFADLQLLLDTLSIACSEMPTADNFGTASHLLSVDEIYRQAAPAIGFVLESLESLSAPSSAQLLELIERSSQNLPSVSVGPIVRMTAAGLIIELASRIIQGYRQIGVTLGRIEASRLTAGELEKHFGVRSRPILRPGEDVDKDREFQHIRCRDFLAVLGFFADSDKDRLAVRLKREMYAALDATAEASPKGVSSDEPANLDSNSAKILRSLMESPHSLIYVDIAAATGLSESTCKSIVPALESRGLVDRPNGKRKGFSVTEAGKNIISKKY